MADVTDTAAAIARIRAEEGERPVEERLFEDPLAHLFAGGEAGGEALDLFERVPFMREYVRARTRFIDDAVRAALAAGLRDVVLLGAGFDTRAFRMPEIAASGALVFEVDLERQLAAKRARLAAAGVALPERLRLVACDFTADGWEDALRSDLAGAGFALRAGAMFVWEGVVGYLDDRAIDRTIAFMASAGGPGTRVTLNYPSFRVRRDEIADRLARGGFAILEDDDAGSVFRRFVPGERVAGDDLFRLAVAHVPRA
ncbi:MAG TPA: SAM-dependent methyltransferase [Candidatus Binatia bacterium]|nr:SAM-dependent methyltransferase [Candidatus Binatia bacterium]